MDTRRHGRGIGGFVPPAHQIKAPIGIEGFHRAHKEHMEHRPIGDGHKGERYIPHHQHGAMRRANQVPNFRAPAIRIPHCYPVADLAERTTIWFDQAYKWIDTRFFPVYGNGHLEDCRHCGFRFDDDVERNVISSIFDDTPRDQAELKMILRVIGFMRALYPRPQVGTYYVMMREHSENPLAFGLMVLMMETLQRAFARKGIRTRWWIHLDEQRGTGRYEHPHAWFKFDGYYDEFTSTEKMWVNNIITRHGNRSLPVTDEFSLVRKGRRIYAQRSSNGPYDGDTIYNTAKGDTIYNTATRLGLMNRLSDGSVPATLNIGGFAHIVAESFVQHLNPIRFQWGRTVQIFVWGLPEGTCFCHAPVDSHHGPRDLQLHLLAQREPRDRMGL